MNYVSIIMPTFSLYDDLGEERKGNGPPRSSLLRKSLESLFKNTDYPCEIIVVDNGGPNDDSDWLVDLVRQGKINTYVRNKNNMFVFWAWMQGLKLATSEYILMTCNDIEFYPNWLSTIIKPLLEYPEEKLIATPVITPDKDKKPFIKGNFKNTDYRLNSMAGSLCMLMTKKTFADVGDFPLAPAGGSYWHQLMCAKGYRIIAPAKNVAFHLGFEGGPAWWKDIKVEKKLLNGEVLDFTFRGKMKRKGVPMMEEKYEKAFSERV